MNSHELAQILLDNPDMPVNTHANNHSYDSKANARSHGELKVRIVDGYGEDHIQIGNFQIKEGDRLVFDPYASKVNYSNLA